VVVAPDRELLTRWTEQQGGARGAEPPAQHCHGGSASSGAHSFAGSLSWHCASVEHVDAATTDAAKGLLKGLTPVH